MNKHIDTKKLLTIDEVCILLNRDRRTIWAWSKKGDFINPVKIRNRTIGFRQADLDKWLDKNSN